MLTLNFWIWPPSLSLTDTGSWTSKFEPGYANHEQVLKFELTADRGRSAETHFLESPSQAGAHTANYVHVVGWIGGDSVNITYATVA